MLSKLASSVKIETVDDLLEAASDWGYASKYGHEVLSLLKDADCKQQRESREQQVKTRHANKKRKLEDLERDERQQDMHYNPSPGPMVLFRTYMINPIIVKHIQHPARPQLPPSRPRPRPTLISRPYTRTDVFDSLMNNPKHG